MRTILIPLALLAASMPGLAHDHGHGRWYRSRPRVVVVERPWRGECYEPRVYVRRSWHACPEPVWEERRVVYEDDFRPEVRFQLNLR